MSDGGTIFIGYAGPDRGHAEALSAALAAVGLDAFVDTLALSPGDVWPTRIVEALEAASLIVVLVSGHWRAAPRLYATDEVIRAVEQAKAGVRVVPVIIGAVSTAAMPTGLTPFVPIRDAARDWAATAAMLRAVLDGETTGHSPGAYRVGEPDVETYRLPSGGRFFLGREDELAALDAAWADPGTRVQAVIGVGGEGKSALVDRWLAGMGDADYRGAARVYGWSFYSQGAGEDRQVSADLFIEQALTWFGDPRPSEGDPWAKGVRLAALIREQPTLLVLDGLEPLQFPPGESEGRIKDPALATLLRELAARMNGLCVVSSRQMLRDFAEGTPGIGVLRLPALSGAVGAEVLRRWGVVGAEEELRAAVVEVKGHALAVNLMGSYLAMFHAGDARQRDRIERLTEAEDGGGHAKRVMAAYDRWLAEADRQVLRIVGLFDRAADAGALGALLGRPVIAGLTDGLEDGVQGRRWKKAVAHLRGLGLLIRAGGAGDEEARRAGEAAGVVRGDGEAVGGERGGGAWAGDGGAVDAHPLVREAFGEMLRGEAPEAWAAGHGRLFEYFCGVGAERPDGLVGLEPLYRAVMHGCAGGRQGEALDVYGWRIKRGGEHYTSRKLGAFAANLAAVAHLFERPWSRPHPGLSAHKRSWLLGEAGFALRALGRLGEAVEPIEAGLALEAEQQHWKNAAIAAGNLSELLLTLGRLDPPGAADGAIARARQAVAHADRRWDAFQRMLQRTALADALHQRGRRAAARALFAETERLQAEMQPGLPRLYALQGYQYGDLLLAERPGEVLERAEWMLPLHQKHLGPLDIALAHLLLGRAALTVEPADPARARRHLDAAVAGLRRAGRQDQTPFGLLARAALHRRSGDLDLAAVDLAEARSIAARGGMRLHLVDADLEAARLALARGEPEAARRAYESAREGVREVRYHRRDGALDELAHALGEAAPGWLHEADVMVELPIDE